MSNIKHQWKRVPVNIRKPLVFTIGMLFVIAAGLTGWLPGPGGIPLFLIGIAILATEFEWAMRLRDRVIGWIHRAGKLYRQHKILGTLIAIASASVVITISILAYRHFK